MSGKQASVPKCKSGFSWNGCTVRELAGAGCLYVRLTSDIGNCIRDSSSDDDIHINKSDSDSSLDFEPLPSYRSVLDKPNSQAHISGQGTSSSLLQSSNRPSHSHLTTSTAPSNTVGASSSLSRDSPSLGESPSSHPGTSSNT